MIYLGDELNKKQEEIFHDRKLFLEDYKEMNTSLKIFVYPHKSNDPFANVLLPYKFEPGGNYASESYFKKALMTSHFITKDRSPPSGRKIYTYITSTATVSLVEKVYLTLAQL